jgi:2-polyprenyl-6-methoxyphenol hydroxylase-like FAD-dependent oxidoreductase
MTQVVIVGAGPTGATLALLLVQRGIPVTLVEAARNFRRVFRGEGLMPSGLDALEQMGLMPLVNRIPHRPLDAWEFFINRRPLFRVNEPLEAGQPCTLVSQPLLLAALIQAASRFPHFEWIQGASVQDLHWRDHRVIGVKLGDDRSLAADLVIGADGRHSLVRQQSQLALEQQSQGFDILWFKLADSPLFEPETVFYSIVSDRHAFGLFRSSEGHLQVGWSLYEHSSLDWKHANWSELFAAASPARLADHFRQQAETIEPPVLLSVQVGCCPIWFVPGVLLLGDAAHPMSPIRAQGINMALRDVLVAANHLVPVLQQAADPIALDAALSQIQSERQPEIIRVQQLQKQESDQGELLTRSALLRWGASHAPLPLRQRIRQSWLARQRQLRQGVAPIQLTV